MFVVTTSVVTDVRSNDFSRYRVTKADAKSRPHLRIL